MHIVLVKFPHVQIAFLKFTSCDNRALVGFIPVACLAVHLNLKSYVSVASFLPILKQNFIAYRSCKGPDCIFKIHQLWQSGFSRVYSSCLSSCSFEPEIIKIGQSSHKMYSNNIVNFSRVYDNFKCLCKKRYVNLLNTPRIYIYLIEHNRHFLSIYFLIILSNCCIDLMIFGGNWLINIP